MDSFAGSNTELEIRRVELLVAELEGRLEQFTHALRATRVEGNQEEADELLQMLAPISATLQKLGARVDAHEKERDQLRALQEVGALINSSLELAEVLLVVMDTIIDLTGAERGFLMLLDEKTGDLEVQIARNMDRETINKASFEISRSIVQHVAKSGEPVVTINAQVDPRFARQESIISYNLLSILCVPLKMKEMITGVIYADNRIASGIFSDTDRDLLAAFANQAAVAIENARLFRQIRDQLADITDMKTLMDDVLASIASGVITIDISDRVALFNRAAERILGLPAIDVLQQPYSLVMDTIEGFDRMVQQVKLNGGQHHVELDTVVTKRVGTTTLNLSFSPLRHIEQEPLGVAIVVDDVSEKKRMESVRRYLPPGLVDQVRNMEAIERPQRRVMSVLFADIRGFSTISENLAPEELIQILNGYFSIAAHAINRFEGIIDKYMGDAIMAEFNTTLNPQEDHVQRAVSTALMMREEIVAYHEALPVERRLFFGVGIHAGEAVAGNVGTHFRKDYSVIGDAVNLAKRLQELARPGQIVVSEAVYEQVAGRVEVRPLPPMQVKGRQNMEQLYELVGER